MTEKREKELLDLIAQNSEYNQELIAPGVVADGYVITNINAFVRALDKAMVTNTRCTEKLRGFINYMNENKDQRFMQGVRNFMKFQFLLSSSGYDHETEEYKDLKDTFYDEEIQD